LLLKADRTKGKFRTFLLTSLRNYATDLHRKSHPTQELDDRVEESSDGSDPEAEFHIVWARELPRSTLGELEAECRSRGKSTHWDVFRTWLMDPDAEYGKLDMSKVCEKYGIDDTNKAYNMVSNLKGRFRKILRRRLRAHVHSDAQVDEEISYFINIFSRSAPRY
jgi:RNA polymerase sigma-70 factor (ECF subfamily)